jgi:hypothetical protein
VILHALSKSISDVYLWAIPVGLLALALSLTLPEVALRTGMRPSNDEAVIAPLEM